MHRDPVRMLLVEDNETDVELVMHVLKRHDLANGVEVVRDGEAALDYLFATGSFAGRSGDDEPKVVVLDLKLPKIGGLEVLTRVKGDERTRKIPVVVLTSSREDRDLTECYRRGANSYVVKPVDPDEFEQVVSQLARYWLKLNQPIV